MKVIDLLNKIANGEEAPKKIKYQKMVFEFKDGKADYVEIDDGQYFLDWVALTIDGLNDEVEIIEEHKIPRKINDILRVDDLIPPIDENMYKIWEQTIKNHNKINEILDYLEEK